MNFSFYRETNLEQLITKLYLKNGPNIQYPEQLHNFDYLSRSFDIEVVMYRGRPFTDKIGRVIFLDERYGVFINRMRFFHEAGHILRHEGDQRRMPALFKAAQEAEAEAFALYAAIPFYLLKQLELPSQRIEIIDYIARTFLVPPKFAEKRLSQIERRIMENQFLTAATGFTEVRQSKHDWDPPLVLQTRIYAYYDQLADIPGPTQFVLEIDSTDMESEGELTFDLNDYFKRLEPEDVQDFEGIQLYRKDLIYKNGQVGVRFPHLASKYGAGAKRFIIHTKDIEQLMEYEVGF